MEFTKIDKKHVLVTSEHFTSYEKEVLDKLAQKEPYIITKNIVPFLDVLFNIAKNRYHLIGIDGRCGSGKSTLGQLISEVFEIPLIHLDDFYLPKELRTKERYATAINLHYERVIEEVMEPIKNRQPLHYGVFSDEILDIDHYNDIPVYDMYVIEGSYAYNPYLRDYFDYKIFLTIPKQHQKLRILSRNGQKGWYEFRDIWIPLEEAYFARYHSCEIADAYIEVSLENELESE